MTNRDNCMRIFFSSSSSFVLTYCTNLYPTFSSVGPSVFFMFLLSLLSLFLPNCPSDPPACDWGSRVSGLVYILFPKVLPLFLGRTGAQKCTPKIRVLWFQLAIIDGFNYRIIALIFAHSAQKWPSKRHLFSAAKKEWQVREKMMKHVITKRKLDYDPFASEKVSHSFVFVFCLFFFFSRCLRHSVVLIVKGFYTTCVVFPFKCVKKGGQVEIDVLFKRYSFSCLFAFLFLFRRLFFLYIRSIFPLI